MRWSSAVSTAPRLADAVREAASAIDAELDGAAPDLILAFVSPHHAAGSDALPALLREALGDGLVLGCSAGGVIGGGREIEGRTGVALTAATLPGVALAPLRLDSPAPLPIDPAEAPSLVLLPDPFTFDTDELLRLTDARWPGARVVGGLASGGHSPGENALYLGDAVHRGGLVGVALTGDVALDTVVAQGCRRLGDPMFVTRSERNVIHDLDGRRAAVVLQELYDTASADDRRLFRQSLFLGVVMREDRQEYGHGDFLIRNVLGIDGQTGALIVGTLVRDGMVVQFHLRDARTSAADLEAMLQRYAGAPAGGLLFSCLGRGEQLYGAPDHDSAAFRRRLGPVPLGGFFCNGEIGPVQGRTHLHGYTSAFGLFRPRAAR